MSSFLHFVRSFGLLIARIGVGAILVLHAWERWRGTGVGPHATYLLQFGVPYASVVSWASLIFEVVGGIFLIVGALTPIVGLGLVIQQVLIICWLKWFHLAAMLRGDDYNNNYELNIALALLGLLFFVMGGGAAAIDRLFRRKKTDLDDDDDAVAASVHSPS